MQADFNTIINSAKPVLVDFYSEWSRLCNDQFPILQDIARYLGNRIKVIKIDIEKNRTVAMKYGVENLPTLMLFKDGELKWQREGVVQREGLIEAIFLNTWKIETD